MNQKLVPDPSFILVNNPKQQLHARNSFKKIYWKKIIKNLFKSYLYFFFQSQSLLMDKFLKNKSSLELVTSDSSGYKKQVDKNYFISNILSDQVWWWLFMVGIIWQFLSYSKNYACKFMQASSWHHKLFHFDLSFWI